MEDSLLAASPEGMKPRFLLVVALVVLVALAVVGATAQALRGERPVLLRGW
jgi:hypothetical protein